MAEKFTAEDSIICILEEFGECSTSFIVSRSPYGREAVYQRLRKLKERGIVEDRQTPLGENKLKNGRVWVAPRPPHPTRAAKKWRLANVNSPANEGSSNDVGDSV